jgi:hypothetical protein
MVDDGEVSADLIPSSSGFRDGAILCGAMRVAPHESAPVKMLWGERR